MKRAIRQIGVCAAVLIAFCVICRLTVLRTYTAYIPLSEQAEAALQSGARIEADAPGVAEASGATVIPGALRIPVRPEGRGDVTLQVRDESGQDWAERFLRVGPFQTIYDLHTGGFTGDNAVTAAVALFWLAVAAIMLRVCLSSRGPAFYAYTTIYAVGLFLFSLVTGLLTMVAAILHWLNPVRYDMYTVYGVINSAAGKFMRLTTPLVAAFALALAVSNIALLRHARFRMQNVFGILIALMLIGGEAVGWFLFLRNFAGSELAYRLSETFQNVYATVFVYGECMLAGSVFCGLKAARSKPALDKDFIVILGCWFRPDGSLPPLLRGRVDRAIAFWRAERETAGKEAILIPSGGQGADETMPEGEAMRRYLLAQGIPERSIRPELKSANTWQNMEFCKQIIDEINPNGRVLFATTNYHVFRSGVWAARAGLPCEGIGSRTKWWYWPNAFVRECIGLLAQKWKQEILFLLILIGFFSLLSMVVR